MRNATLLSGGSGATGVAVANHLLRQGRNVVIASRSPNVKGAASITEPISDDTLLFAHATDLTSETQVGELHQTLIDAKIRVANIVHLVGGWSGGKGILGQSDEKYRSLAASFDSLRFVSREFFSDLAASAAPRLVTVSSQVAQQPTPGSANYASVKAATEAWTFSCHAALQAEANDGAASIVITDSLATREESFAELVSRIIDAPAKRVGGRRILHV